MDPMSDNAFMGAEPPPSPDAGMDPSMMGGPPDPGLDPSALPPGMDPMAAMMGMGGPPPSPPPGVPFESDPLSSPFYRAALFKKHLEQQATLMAPEDNAFASGVSGPASPVA